MSSASQAETAVDVVAPAAPLNTHLDIGNLLFEDSQSYQGISMEDFARRTAANLCSVYRALYELKKK